jgi:FAD/FMN-containing dehydrogenase
MAAESQVAGGLKEDIVQTLAASLRGKLIRPSDPEYDDARHIWNGMIDRYPALIVRVHGTADVVTAVNFAREHGLRLAIRGGGHNVAGNVMCDGGLVIDLSLMRGVFVDPAARIARVQGGAIWSDVDRETQLFGLATPSDVISTTGVAGLTLHGGYGRLRRKYGLTVDNLLSVEIVCADGQVRTASKTENEDLFWAVRGAGSNFGVVTSFAFQLHPVGPVVAAAIPLYAAAEAPIVAAKWRDFSATAPDEISSDLIFSTLPAHAPIPPELQGRAVVGIFAMFSGPAEEGERLLAPLREFATPLLDLSGTVPYVWIQSGFDASFPKGDRYYQKARDLDHLSDEVIQELCARIAAPPSPRTIIEVLHNGGAMSRVGMEETAYGRRNAPYYVNVSTQWTEPAENAANIAWARDCWASLGKFSSGGMYLNFPGFGEEKENLVRTGYGPNYARLTHIKAKYDPTNLFRMNQNIVPAP